VTAGPTREAIDPARFISNPSTGRMGFALAAEALRRGAGVTLIAGPTPLPPPPGADLVRVTTAREMLTAALNQAQGADLILKTAAVADYTPEAPARAKLKKEALRKEALRARAGGAGLVLRLRPTHDILEELGRRKKPGQVLVGFAAETEALEENARRKLRRKNLDLVVANRIGRAGEGFESETNRAIVLDRDGGRTDLPLMGKDAMAAAILDLAQRYLAPAAPRAGTGRVRRGGVRESAP
jgi:phosphopantothenoylcysteine decarboxylase/phosphopantothenate--cysteine ligase